MSVHPIVGLSGHGGGSRNAAAHSWADPVHRHRVTIPVDVDVEIALLTECGSRRH
jgi:hypothetical protein